MDQFDLLVQTLGGTVRVPRQVLDLDEDQFGDSRQLSELGKAERYWLKRSRDPHGTAIYSKLRALRLRQDIEVVDLSDDELVAYGEIRGRAFTKRLDLAAPLGVGESAVMAIAENRRWEAIIDDYQAREALNHRDPTVVVATTRDLLRRAVSMNLETSPGASLIYDEMLIAGYRGPPTLW